MFALMLAHIAILDGIIAILDGIVHGEAMLIVVTDTGVLSDGISGCRTGRR